MNKLTVGDLGNIITGKTPRTNIPENYGGTIPFLTPSDDLTPMRCTKTLNTLSEKGMNEVKSCLLPRNAICVSCIGSDMGHVIMTSIPTVTNQQFNSIIPSEDYCPEYVYYLMVLLGKMMKSKFGKSSTAVPIVSKSLFSSFELFVNESKNEQKVLADVLRCIDDKIYINNRMNAELEAMAKQLYDYWFVQFDFPDENGNPYKSSGGKMVYNSTLKREIPEGWKIECLNHLVENYRGVSYNKENLVSESEESILVLRGNNIPSSGQFVYDGNVAYIPKSFVSKEQEINKGDIIITMSSGSKEHIGKCYMFQNDSKHTFGAFLSKFVPHFECRYFVYLCMLSDFFKAFVKTTCNGTGINNLTNDTFNNVYFPVPASRILEKFEATAGCLYNKVGLCQEQNNDLIQLRDSLLPMLMNGQVTVE